MLVKFTRMHRQWMPGQVADLGAGIADALVRSRRAIYADADVRGLFTDRVAESRPSQAINAPGKTQEEPKAVVKKSPRRQKSAKLS